MKITREVAACAVKGAYEVLCDAAGKKLKITLGLCHSVANLIYNRLGMSVTTLFCEEVLLSDK